MKIFISWTGEKGNKTADIQKEISDQWEEHMIPFFRELIDHGMVISSESFKAHEARFNNIIPELLKKAKNLKFSYYISYHRTIEDDNNKYANLPELKWKY